MALPHTEGCGSKGKTIRDNYDNILVGHLTHPLVASALILEHGCESEHNEEMKSKLTTRGVPLTRQKQVAEVSEKAATGVGEQKTEDAFGWASVQYDGGIQNVYAKAQKWFQQTTLSSLPKAMPAAQTPSWSGVGVGFVCAPHYPLTHAEGRVVALAVTAIVRAGGFVVVPQQSPLLREARFLDVVLETRSQLTPTLLYGQSIAYSSKGAKSAAGLHIMAEDSSSQWIETLTALASTGVQCTGVLSHTAMATNPLVPTLTVMPSNKRKGSDDADSTLFLSVGVGETEAEMHGRCARALLEDIAAVLSRKRMPQSMMLGDLAFQLSRGKMGVSV